MPPLRGRLRLEQEHRLSGQQLAGDHTSNFSPALAAMGEVLAMGDQALSRWQVSNGMQLGPGWCRKKWQVMQT